MNAKTESEEQLFKRVHEELLDDLDEELEMEVEDRVPHALRGAAGAGGAPEAGGEDFSRQEYFRELFRLQGELVKVQDWVLATRRKLVIIFEGRDAAGKGGTIKAISERVSPRVFHVVALPAPSDREKGQLYLQRYVAHLPTAGEIVIFDRSW